MIVAHWARGNELAKLIINVVMVIVAIVLIFIR